MMTPETTRMLAQQCENVFNDAVATLGNDIGGFSVLDLCADNLQAWSLADLKRAILASNIRNLGNERIRRAMDVYSRTL